MSETEPVKFFQSETKRLNYYNSQFLKEEDFRDEQLYHSQMRRFHNRSLHTWGVVAGLEVRPVAGARKVTVTPGTAIDRLGREIVLAREIVLPPESVPPPDAEADAAGFDAFDANSTVYLTIKYREVFDPADKDTQSKNYRRTTERPQLALSAAAPADGAPEVVLAAVALDGDKAIARVGAEVRRYAGSRFGTSADGKEFSIYADTAGAWHFFDGAKDADRLTFDGKGNVGIGTTAPATPLQVTSGKGKTDAGLLGVATFSSKDETNALGLKIAIKGDTDANASQRYASLQVEDGSAKRPLALQPGGGNVGIGTNSPGFPLQVGNIDVAGSWKLCVAGRGSTGNYRQWTLRTGDGDTTADIHKLRIRDEQANADRFVIDQDGNVGIGTNPDASSKLEVAGKVKAASFEGALAASNITGKLGADKIDGQLSQWVTGQGNISYSAGKVGIGTSNPTTMLSIRTAVNTSPASVPPTVDASSNGTVITAFPGVNPNFAQFKVGDVVRAWDQQGTIVKKNSDFEIEVDQSFGNRHAPTTLVVSHDIFRADGPNGYAKFFIAGNGNVGVGTSAPGALLDVNGRIMRKGQDFSSAGTVDHNGMIAAPWGKREDWNILVSPRFMGREELNSEGDNAMLVVDCKADASPNTDNSWTVTARYKYKWGNANNQTQWENGSANYLIVPR